MSMTWKLVSLTWNKPVFGDFGYNKNKNTEVVKTGRFYHTIKHMIILPILSILLICFFNYKVFRKNFKNPIIISYNAIEPISHNEKYSKTIHTHMTKIYNSKFLIDIIVFHTKLIDHPNWYSF